MQLGSMFISNCNNAIIAVTNKHPAKLHHVGSLYILTYDARKLKHKKHMFTVTTHYKLLTFESCEPIQMVANSERGSSLS